MGVNGGGVDVTMAQQVGYFLESGSVLDQVAGQGMAQLRVATIIEGLGVRIIEGWGKAASVEVEEAGRRCGSQRATHVSRNRGPRSNRGKVGVDV
jgi:hypothetical protein